MSGQRQSARGTLTSDSAPTSLLVPLIRQEILIHYRVGRLPGKLAPSIWAPTTPPYNMQGNKHTLLPGTSFKIRISPKLWGEHRTKTAGLERSRPGLPIAAWIGVRTHPVRNNIGLEIGPRGCAILRVRTV